MLRINMWMKIAMIDTSRATQLHVLTRAALIAATVATCSVLTAQSAKAITRYEITLTCPIDGQRFTATLMGSYFQSGMRLDFKPIGSLVAPYPYPVCPGNGFVMYKDAFSDNELSAIRAIVLSDEYRQLRIKNTDYFMVAYVKQRLGANHYELGNTYLRASWEAETASLDWSTSTEGLRSKSSTSLCMEMAAMTRIGGRLQSLPQNLRGSLASSALLNFESAVYRFQN